MGRFLFGFVAGTVFGLVVAPLLRLRHFAGGGRIRRGGPPVRRPDSQPINVDPITVTLPAAGGPVDLTFPRPGGQSLPVGELHLPPGAVATDTTVTVEVPRGSRLYEAQFSDIEFAVPVSLTLQYAPAAKPPPAKGKPPRKFQICELGFGGECIEGLGGDDRGDRVTASVMHLSRYAVAQY